MIWQDLSRIPSITTSRLPTVEVTETAHGRRICVFWLLAYYLASFPVHGTRNTLRPEQVLHVIALAASKTGSKINKQLEVNCN